MMGLRWYFPRGEGRKLIQPNKLRSAPKKSWRSRLEKRNKKAKQIWGVKPGPGICVVYGFCTVRVLLFYWKAKKKIVFDRQKRRVVGGLVRDAGQVGVIDVGKVRPGDGWVLGEPVAVRRGVRGRGPPLRGCGGS